MPPFPDSVLLAFALGFLAGLVVLVIAASALPPLLVTSSDWIGGLFGP